MRDWIAVGWMGMAALLLGCGGAEDASPDADDVAHDAATDTTSDLGVDPGAVDVAAQDPPTLASITPASGDIAGNRNVVFRGERFVAPCQAYFDDVVARATRPVDERTLSVVTPPGAGPGPIDVRLDCANGSATVSGGYTYEQAEGISLTAISPTFGSTVGGAAVTLTGRAFEAGTRDLVAFGGRPAQDIVVVDETTVTATTPAASAGPASVTVALGSGNAVLPDGWLYLDPITAVDVSPNTAIAGDTVVLSGTGLHEFAGIAVTVGGQTADSSQFGYNAEGTLLSLTVPEGAQNNGDEGASALIVIAGTLETVQADALLAIE